ncbi:hypothetical protein AAEU41_24640 [Pantoea agglomerans]
MVKQTTLNDTTAGSLLTVGSFGLGTDSAPYIPASGNQVSGLYSITGGASHNPAGAIGVSVIHSATGQYGSDLAVSMGGVSRAWIRMYSSFQGGLWSELYTTANTTKASDGTLKAASPIARIVTSQDACQRADIAVDGFVWCGCGTANAEAEGITLSRLEVGVYVLTGSAGLASEGWQLLPPMDPGGMGELGVVEADQTESGGLTIRLFKRKYILSDEGEIIKTKGELMDVPANSWIDVRLDMPENSAWNQRQKEAVEPAS